LVLNLDGVVGSWDLSHELFVLRHKFLESIPSLSQEFSVVAISTFPKHLIKRLVLSLQRVPVLSNPGKYPPVYV
jgi:hypothetical protein